MKVLGICLVLALAGCSGAPNGGDQRVSDLVSLRSAEEAAIQAFGARDAARMIAAYAPEATLMLTNMPALHGPDLAATLRSMASDPRFTMRFNTLKMDVSKSGELGYTRGSYVMTMTDLATGKVMTERGKYLTLYAKQTDGKWKIIEDISNADTPATEIGASK
jgi:ketosteroid isomerase-like protein